jgi:hypothetical protein
MVVCRSSQHHKPFPTCPAPVLSWWPALERCESTCCHIFLPTKEQGNKEMKIWEDDLKTKLTSTVERKNINAQISGIVHWTYFSRTCQSCPNQNTGNKCSSISCTRHHFPARETIWRCWEYLIGSLYSQSTLWLTWLCCLSLSDDLVFDSSAKKKPKNQPFFFFSKW